MSYLAAFDGTTEAGPTASRTGTSARSSRAERRRDAHADDRLRLAAISSGDIHTRGRRIAGCRDALRPPSRCGIHVAERGRPSGDDGRLGGSFSGGAAAQLAKCLDGERAMLRLRVQEALGQPRLMCPVDGSAKIVDGRGGPACGFHPPPLRLRKHPRGAP